MKDAFSAADERFMRRALALAERGRGTTRPNPVVGAVIVRGGRVVGEGFHVRAGQPHAEIVALARCKADAARGATLYVNLEPCRHTGRTGPCTEAILAAGLARVVVGCGDPNPLVDGRGVARLRAAGVRVDVGCLERESREINRAFAVWVRERRPRVTLKAAATLDGFIADGKPRGKKAPAWLTGVEARRVAHELRAAHDAVLVGAGTVLA
ncbi:MAG: riboflavin biosynthesis protein RibD, partial [Myxococcales bacterium]|nr:riboflavin biosynthesis protein RibD [Myxococcales bacterium]